MSSETMRPRKPSLWRRFGDPEGGDGCGERLRVRLAVSVRIGGVRDHDEGQRAMQLAKGKHVFFPICFQVRSMAGVA